MSKEPVFLEYDAEQKEQDLVKLFEEQTGKTLYPAQDERLLISLIEYKAALLVNLFNDAAKLNLTQYSRGLILDCIGEMFDTPRLKGEYGTDTLRITLNTTFENDLTIAKGLEILSKDEEYVFETTEDLIIPAGQTSGDVFIKAKEIGSAVNVYGADDVNILIKPLSYIDTITNLNGIEGGADEEDDESYRTRILLAPEKFTCAGSRQSYIYHALSANTNIIDATAESVIQPATVKIGSTTYEEENGEIITPDFTVKLDRKYGQFKFTLNNVEYTFKMPPDTTVNIYPLTDYAITPEEVLESVENRLNGEKVNPMTDNVIALSPTKISKTISLNVKVDNNADLDVVEELVNEIANEYKMTMRKSLGKEIIPSQIVSKIGAIDGVYSVDTGDLVKTTANLNEYFDITFDIEVDNE